MARLTKQERATLKELSERAKAEDDADAAYELTVETASGHKVKLTGEKARRYAAKHGLELDDDEDTDDETDELEDDEELEDEDEGRGKRRAPKLKPDAKAGGDGGYLRRRG